MVVSCGTPGYNSPTKDQGQQTDPWRLGRAPKQVSRKSFRSQNMGCRGYTVMFSRIWERCWDRLTVPTHGAGILVEGHIATTLCLKIDVVSVVQCTAAGAGSLPTNDTKLFRSVVLVAFFFFLLFFSDGRSDGISSPLWHTPNIITKTEQKTVSARTYTYINIALYLYIPSHRASLNWITAYNSIVGMARPKRYSRRKYNQIFITLAIKKKKKQKRSLNRYINLWGQRFIWCPGGYNHWHQRYQHNSIGPTTWRINPEGRSRILLRLEPKEHPAYMSKSDNNRCHVHQRITKVCCLIW